MESRIFDICSFKVQPIDREHYVEALEKVLKAEIPATITTKDVEQIQRITKELNDQINNKETEAEPELEKDQISDHNGTGTSPLHMICSSLEPSISGSDLEIALDMIDILFQWGAGWMQLDDNNETPGCIALRRGLPQVVYDKFVSAGVRSEVLLRRLTEVKEVVEVENQEPEDRTYLASDPAVDQSTFLKSDLEYTDHTLVTAEQKDGVMMDWEEPIMKQSADIMVSNIADDDKESPIVLNVGFGMGIIDGFLQQHKPYKHYICEAHPDVIKKLREEGWYEKPNVVILEGTWQDQLTQLITNQVYFDGIYYDTFSEHYDDLVEFFDSVVALLKPNGVFSFFNGLGADRQICYDVYNQVVEIDLANYGLQVTYKDIIIARDDSKWDGIRWKYWVVDTYKLPICQFISFD